MKFVSVTPAIALVLSSIVFSSSIATASENVICESLMSSRVRGDEVQIPEVASELKRVQAGRPTKLIIGMGNFGKQWDHTPHNLGSVMVEAMSRKFKFMGGRPGFESENATVAVNWDNSETSYETRNFKTEAKWFRTNSGEIKILPEKNQLLVSARYFGDYNEVGEFLVPLMKALGVTSKDVVIVSDDLKSEGISQQVNVEIAAAGNNARKSILSHILIDLVQSDLVDLVKSRSELQSIADVQNDLKQIISDFKIKTLDNRVTNFSDASARLSALIKIVLAKYNGRDKSIIAREMVQKLSEKYRESIVFNTYTIGTAGTLREYLDQNPDKTQRDYVLSQQDAGKFVKPGFLVQLKYWLSRLGNQ